MRFDQSGGSVYADNETSGDLGIECSAMASLFHAQDSLDPCYDFVTGRIGRLVEIDDTGRDVGLQVAFQRSTTAWDWSEMSGPHKDYLSRVSLSNCPPLEDSVATHACHSSSVREATRMSGFEG